MPKQKEGYPSSKRIFENSNLNYSGRGKRQRDPQITLLEKSDLENAMSAIPKQYRYWLAKVKDRINLDMVDLYGRPVQIEDTKLGEMNISIKNTVNTCNCTLKEVGVAIRKHVGEVSFSREIDGLAVAIPLELITQAFLAVMSKRSVEEVRGILSS